MLEEDRIDWRPLKWLGKVVLGIILAFPMAFLLEAYAYNSHRDFLTPGMKYASAHHHNESLIGNSIGIAFNADWAFCFFVLCCLNYAFKFLRKVHSRR